MILIAGGLEAAETARIALPAPNRERFSSGLGRTERNDMMRE
jgi:hypothetical protein